MKAIALVSGGLDSLLAARAIKEQGIEIIPVNFKIPFCHRSSDYSYGRENFLEMMVNNLGVQIKTIDISDEFIKMLKNPTYGYGANMNPCIDCKILMLSQTKELMSELNAAFVVTGEVLGQRPMSQHKQALYTIAKKAGLEGLVLRPLSAKLLLETIPEKEGWISRERLLSFSGRTRKPQIELSRAFGIKEYAQPAGGCLLTDPGFAKRLKDLIGQGELDINNIELLKIGRHFRLAPNVKLVVGRDERENERLVDLAQDDDYLFFPGDELAGPTSLGRGDFNAELIKIASSITCRYCDLNGSGIADIRYKRILGEQLKALQVLPIEEAKLINLRV
jgi:hypothetical protein